MRIAGLLRPVAAGIFLIGCSWINDTSAYACSLPAGYRGPETNFDLVQQADTIMVGTLVKSVGNDEFERKILVRPTQLLKGRSLPKTVHIRGFLSDRTVEINEKEYALKIKKSEALDLWRPHPEVWMGGCSRSQFEKGTQLLLFFKNEAGELKWYNPPFTRSSEDVTDADALWVRAVGIYARIARLPKPAQRPPLISEMETLRKKDAFGRNESTLLADDIERALAGVGPVSGFDTGPKSATARAWADNITEQMYFSLPQPLEIKQGHGRSKWPQASIWIGLGLLVSSIVAAGLVFMRKRKAETE